MKKNRRSTRRLPPALSSPANREEAHQGIWSGTISFSLVAIPVHLVKAVEPGRVSFRMLHTRDFSPLLRRMVCPREERIVAPDEIIRGYEIGPDRYLAITDQELESVSPERSRTIEILEFIHREDLDPVYYDHPYYLVPAKGGEKAYRLLVEVLLRTRKAGLAKFVLGEREYLVVLASTHGALCLTTLHYSEEILPPAGLAPASAAVEANDTKRLKGIIRDMMADFAPDNYADERRRRIVRLLAQKAKAQAPVEAPEIEEEEAEAPVDLIAALENSMRRIKKGRR